MESEIKQLERGWKRRIYSTGGVFYEKEIGNSQIAISIHKQFIYTTDKPKPKKCTYFAVFGQAPYGLTATEEDKDGKYAFTGKTEKSAFKAALRAVKDYYRYVLKYKKSF